MLKSVVSIVTHGVSLTREESSATYVVIRHNVRTYESGGVMIVIKGRTTAESCLLYTSDAADE